jgi:hypothetical protein
MTRSRLPRFAAVPLPLVAPLMVEAAENGIR